MLMTNTFTGTTLNSDGGDDDKEDNDDDDISLMSRKLDFSFENQSE